MEKEKNDKNIIRIILNINKEVLYSNVNINMAKNYLKVLISSYDSFNDMPVQSCFKKYQVVIDRFILNNQTFFLIVIAKMADCNNCVKAIRDEVTGLYNRNYLEFIKREALPINMDKYLSLILIDVDNLKMLNDTYGHLAGDKVIRIVGQAIKKGIRQKDLGIRFGGDEFIILLPTKDKMATEKVVTRIRETIHEMAKKAQDRY